ncbi:universal stress protein [Sphingobacterium lactis]|uniref:Nucleotide-binding universal stress protein, UspA family n=1 Tax=Sphingobacterium lactis TaxID=797291 RepID=A0A1H6CF37_9SPHI|nr:universal stress protein [Sphingobacterium lactis]SEG71621.1 Nucleotide-binding universal stress protein, UspA family [Sphingobacterium lactis]
MSKLLIPIDFSEFSENAVRYAAQVAADAGQEIDLVHVFSSHSNSYLNAQGDMPLTDPNVPEAEENMKKAVESFQKEFPSATFNPIFRNGNLYDEIKEVTNATPYDAVVMGTKGASGLEAVFIGSNTYDTILNTTTPVLAVPVDCTSYKHDTVGLLCNFKEAELTALQQALPLFKTNYRLVLIHVNTNDRPIKDIDAQFKEWINRIESEIGISDISYIIKPQTLFMRQKESVAQAITSVLLDEQVEILILTKSKKSVFRQLTESNVIKKMAFDIKIPTFFARVLK